MLIKKRITKFEYHCIIVDDSCEVVEYCISSYEYMTRRDIRAKLDKIGCELVSYTSSQTITTYVAELEDFLKVAKPN